MQFQLKDIDPNQQLSNMRISGLPSSGTPIDVLLKNNLLTFFQTEVSYYKRLVQQKTEESEHWKEQCYKQESYLKDNSLLQKKIEEYEKVSNFIQSKSQSILKQTLQYQQLEYNTLQQKFLTVQTVNSNLEQQQQDCISQIKQLQMQNEQLKCTLFTLFLYSFAESLSQFQYQFSQVNAEKCQLDTMLKQSLSNISSNSTYRQLNISDNSSSSSLNYPIIIELFSFLIIAKKENLQQQIEGLNKQIVDRDRQQTLIFQEKELYKSQLDAIAKENQVENIHKFENEENLDQTAKLRAQLDESKQQIQNLTIEINKIKDAKPQVQVQQPQHTYFEKPRVVQQPQPSYMLAPSQQQQINGSRQLISLPDRQVQNPIMLGQSSQQLGSIPVVGNQQATNYVGGQLGRGMPNSNLTGSGNFGQTSQSLGRGVQNSNLAGSGNFGQISQGLGNTLSTNNNSIPRGGNFGSTFNQY